MYQLYQQQILQALLSELWDFISHPANLNNITPHQQFVDEQRVGPYKLWYHYHGLEEVDGGVKMTDHVRYIPPYGLIGKAVNALMCRRKLESIFAFRKKVLKKRFNKR